jgi:ubiquinone/menaquinone biosynthesis C-methylase UbiE
MARHLPVASDRLVLDLGSGTGWFAVAIVEWFGTAVLGLEPAEGMRREAQCIGAHPRVTYLGGRAEAIPLRERTCASAWLSTVIHHVTDLHACARELGRVLVPDARVLIRSAFPGRHAGITLFRFFPAARKIAETFPSVEGITDAFASARFVAVSLESVAQVSAPSLAVYAEHVRAMRHVDSTLAALDDDEFARGWTVLETTARAERVPAPVVDRLDLLVLQLRR